MPALRACRRSRRVQRYSAWAPQPTCVPQRASTAGGSAGTRTERRPNSRADPQHQAPDRRMQVHVLVRVGMVQRQAGSGKRRELGTNFRRKLAAHARTKEIAYSRAATDRMETSLPHPRDPGISAGGNTACPSIATRCSPTRSPGNARARRTASAAAGPATIRLAAFSTPSRIRAFDRFVDGLGQAEIIGRENDALHAADVAISAARRPTPPRRASPHPGAAGTPEFPASSPRCRGQPHRGDVRGLRALLRHAASAHAAAPPFLPGYRRRHDAGGMRR